MQSVFNRCVFLLRAVHHGKKVDRPKKNDFSKWCSSKLWQYSTLPTMQQSGFTAVIFPTSPGLPTVPLVAVVVVGPREPRAWAKTRAKRVWWWWTASWLGFVVGNGAYGVADTPRQRYCFSMSPGLRLRQRRPNSWNSFRPFLGIPSVKLLWYP